MVSDRTHRNCLAIDIKICSLSHIRLAGTGAHVMLDCDLLLQTAIFVAKMGALTARACTMTSLLQKIAVSAEITGIGYG